VVLTISKENLEKFLGKLGKEYRVFDARKDGLPPKQYFFPPEEETFFQSKKGAKIESPKATEKFVVFGLSREDLEALAYLDEIMSKGEEDPFYFQRRKNAIVIGVVEGDCHLVAGGDILFEEAEGDKYLVCLQTAKGKKLAKENGEFFDENGDKAVPLIKEKPETWEEPMQKLLLDGELLAEAVEWSHGNKIWDELEEKCLGCGICTYVCPICHCFSNEDKVELTGKCSRCRKWDACTLPRFSKIGGGFNFRPKLKDRYYNWFYHKFVRAYAEYGKPQCVGCGRCQKYCPASIDIQEVLRRIVDEYKAQKNG
jgi:sulfhydrogenase subunit beta (sulfur reductase)